MKQEIKGLWTSSLRSGEYKQAREQLRSKWGFCCLGVLVDLFHKETGIGEWVENTLGFKGFKLPDGHVKNSNLPELVMEWAGLRSSDPSIRDYGNAKLSELNDVEAMTFHEISNIIDEHL